MSVSLHTDGLHESTVPFGVNAVAEGLPMMTELPLYRRYSLQ